MNIIKQFLSKKNNVLQVEKDGQTIVLKQYRDISNAKREYEILQYLSNNDIQIPTVISNNSEGLYMEYVEGITLLDYYMKLENDCLDDYLSVLVSLSKYHKKLYSVLDKYKTNTILGDMNFRNYIIKDNQIFRIDFEECKEGSLESDIGKMAAFALTYNPSFTPWKQKFTSSLIHVFSEELRISKNNIAQEMEKELEEMKVRRG